MGDAAVTEDPQLRPSRPDDLPALVDVFVAAFQHGYRTLLPPDVLAGVDLPTVSGWFAGWDTYSDRPPLHTVVADIDSVPRGFVRFGDGATDDTENVPPPDAGPEPGRVGYIAALYVHPDAAGAGVGRRLLEHAVTALAADGYRAVTLWVFAGNERARGLYASAGFLPDGTETTDPRWRVRQIRLRREDIDA
jgi:ribosomal protein S18 acetylase RimI-like enzyme